VEGAGLVPRAGGPADASLGFTLKSRLAQERYYTIRVIRHGYVIGTDEMAITQDITLN